MSDRATLQAELLLLSGKVRDDTLTPGDAGRLDELLQADDAAKALYVRYMSVVSLLESRGLGQRITSEEPEAAEEIDHNVFAELLELEARAEVELVEKPRELHLFVPSKKTPLQLGGAMQWVIQQPAFWSGAAAVLVIAITLALVFGGDDNKPTNETAQQPVITTTPNASKPIAPVTQAVATLTAERDAVWSTPTGPAALAAGASLSPGTHLTLTAGFAEITTEEGAVVILQAPATIEFTHHDNAIRLHTGKLVGICETDSSKGFLVRTPHLDITDLGTRFGIQATATATEVHVFEGKVQAERKGVLTATEPMRLTTGQSASASAHTQSIAAIVHDADHFATLLPTTIQLPGTGVGLKVGDTDPNWQIVAIDGKPLDRPVSMRVSDKPAHLKHFPNDSQNVQWLEWIRPGGARERVTTYTIRAQFELPSDLDPLHTKLHLSYVADNNLQAARLNGIDSPVPSAIVDPNHDRAQAQADAFTEQFQCTIERGVVRGNNRIEFEVQDFLNVIGLRLQWELRLDSAAINQNAVP